ncbi:MAG TPA: amino acid adenylation domain-containing protein, partial [Thermoanaerobaculia bacterium]|nr:amino acid adenylation domain-containing protein [Thermoanaerobaculia bacterium]
MSDPRLDGLSPAKRQLLLDRLRQKAAQRESQAVPPLTAVPRPPDGMPLSFGQQQLWVIEQLAPGGALYNIPAHIVLDGDLDHEALAASLAGVVARHEALRTRFVRVDGQPRQVVAPAPPADLPCVDLMGLPDPRREALRLAADESGRPFDLEHGRLLRATLLRLAPRQHVLLLNLHHIASDGWSSGVLQREVAAFYEARRTGRPAVLPELPVQYADFAWHQRQWLEGERLEALLGYWRERLADPPPPLPLPFDRPRPAVRSQEGRSVASGPESFPPGFAATLTRLGEPRGATLFIVLLAAFQTLLSRVTGQTDVVLGTPVANRERSEVEGLIGYFVNTLVLRTDLAGDPSFLELLERTRETAVGAFAHQALPLEKLVEEVKPERDLSLTPLFQAAFALQNAPVSSLSLPGLTLSMLAGEGGAPAKFDLTLLAVEEEGSLALSLDFAAALFDAPTVQRLLGGYAHLLQGIAADPDRPLSALPLLSAAELHQLQVEWNDTAVRADRPMVHQAIAELARRAPEAPAVYDGSERLTYGEWDARAGRLRNLLRSRGVGIDDRVAICLERSALALTAMLGVLKAGAAYVPLDPAHPDERLAFMVEDCGAKVLLTRRSLLDARPALGEGIETIFLDEIGDVDASGEDAPVRPEDLCYVIYTSGSTGKPKGVGIEHRSLSNLVAWQQRRFGITAADRATHLSGQGFDATILEIWPYLTAGAAVEVVEEEVRLSPADLLARLEASAVTACFLPTPLAELVLAEIEKRPALAGGLALRVLATGGDRLKRVPAAPLPFRLLNLYGPTEGTVAATALEVGPMDGAPPIGRPLDNVRVHLLDDRLQPVPLGVAGEICIGGAGIARGYLGRPRQTAAVFLPDPWSPVPGARLYRTGDRARHLPDGRIEFLGRVDRQVKVRGFRLEPGEIEAVLADHPEVRACAVLVREDTPGDRRLVAYVETSAEVQNLAVWLRGKLPGYMVPSAFLALDSLPLTANGKVDRQALLHIRPEAAPAAPAAPRTEAEEAVAAVWSEVLQRPDVGADDNFFDLGGHSLLLVQVHERLRERFPQVQVLDLFRHPTVASLAAHLAPAEEAVPPVVERREAQGSGGSGDVAVIGMSGRFPGAADVEALWSNLLQGVEAIRFLSDEELARAGVAPDVAASPSYVRALAACAGIDLFDAGFFGFTPREAEATDPQHRLFLEHAWEALESAGYDPAAYRGRIGVYGGAGLSGYQWNLYSNRDVVQSLGALQAKVAIDKDFLATRVSYKLGLTGPSFTVQTACSTSLVAVHLACRALLDGECDMALAGGVSLNTNGGVGYSYEEGGILSPDGHCRTFDAAARGTVPGEGVGVVLLKRLADALADGDAVDAVIKGSAINNDGSQKVGYTAPGVDGQAEVLRAALAASGVDPRTVTYVEAHGTATPLGDPIEVAALTQAFGDVERGEGRSQRCALGSIKTNIGHLDCAAGVAGLIKTVLALRHGVIPPSLHFERPNPQIDFAAGPFYVNTAATPWEVKDGPRRAGVSSFGIGGTNAHAVLEEAPAVEALASSPDAWHLLVLSARGDEALERATVDLAAHLERHPDLDPADVAYTLQVGRRAFDHRRAVLCRGLDDARAALAARDPRRVLTGRRSGGPVAFLFPGQGAQKTGMGRDLYRAWPSFRAEVDRAAEVLCPHLGLDLRDLLFPPPERRDEAEALLVETRYTQPALFVVEHALARLWMSWGLKPWAFLGHSAGEYVAACLAGVFSLEDALELVALRGQLIQALPPGAMLSVPVSAAEALPFLTPELSLAAVNAIDRSVVSGPAPAIEDLRRRLSERGFEGRPLATSHAFHSPMMDPAIDVLARTVARIHPQPPRIPYLSNVTGTWIRPEEATDPAYWGRHLRETVRFADGLRELLPRTGVLLEVGPGETLARLARRELRAGLKGGTSGTPVISSLPA